MGKLLKYIAEETQGACFTSFKYCYDTINAPAIKYGEAENEYTNLKEYAEDVHVELIFNDFCRWKSTI